MFIGRNKELMVMRKVYTRRNDLNPGFWPEWVFELEAQLQRINRVMVESLEEGDIDVG